MTLERALRLVRQYTSGGSDAVVAKVAARMVATGECVWHAAAVVSGKVCHCADCSKGGR